MNIKQKARIYALCAILAMSGLLQSCSTDSSSDESCQDDACQDPGGNDQPGNQPGGNDQPGNQPGGNDQPGNQPGGNDQPSSGKFDITGGRSLQDNIVKYYDLAEGQMQPSRSITLVDFSTQPYQSNTSTEYVKNCKQSYKFEYTEESVRFKTIADISDYSILTFSVYVPESEKGKTLYLIFTSDNPDSSGEDYYGQRITFENSGWNDIRIDLNKMEVTRSPRGWNHIHEVILTATGWEQDNKLEGSIYLENFVLHTDPAADLKKDVETTLVDFSDKLYASGASTKYVKTGTHSYEWKYTESMISLTTPEDLSGYEAISLWVYVPESAVGQTFYMDFLSENPSVNGEDYYGKLVTLNQAGWNKFTFRLTDFAAIRTPRGWNHIDRLVISSIGWEQQNDTSTVIYLNNLIMHTKAIDMSAAPIPELSGAAFSINGSRAIVDNVLINNSSEDETSRVFVKDNEYWLPLSVFGARYDKASIYQPQTHALQMTLHGKLYQFEGNQAYVTVDGQKESLDFTVAVKGDTLFAPSHYIKTLMGYTEQYIDEMGLIYLSKDSFDFTLLTQRLNVMYETLFLRPTGAEIITRMNSHLGGDVHPRILLTQKDFDRLKVLRNENEVYASYIDYMIRRYGPKSEDYQSKPVEYGLPDGVRLLERSRLARNRIIPWAVLYKVTGEEHYVQRIWKEVESVLNFPGWHPEHYLDTAEIVYTMAIAFDWLYDVWSEEQRQRMAETVVKYGFQTGLDRYEGRIGIWSDTNWNGVCNGGLTSAALAFANHPAAQEAAQHILDYAIKDVERGMYTYAPDGGYVESPGYWAYGTDYLHVLFSSLKSATGSNFGLFHSPAFAKSAYFTTYLENDAGMWGFHDAKNTQSDTWTHQWFARESGDTSLGLLRQNAIASKTKGIHFYDAMYYDPKQIGDSVTLNLDAYYSQVDVVTMRNHWDTKSIFTGLHGGDNGVPHGDLDIGNFVIYGEGKQFIVELGTDNYNLPEYRNRYKKRAEGQNTLVIGDVSYKIPDQVANAVAHITRHEGNAHTSIAVVDMKPAYVETVSTAVRGLLFTDDRSTIVVQDEITLKSPQVVRWSAHTTGNIEIAKDGRSATISIEGASKRLYAEIVSSDTSLKFTSGKANSFDPNYFKDSTSSEIEDDRSMYRKLMIISPEVSTFNNAVVFKFIEPNTTPSAGSLYQWHALDSWSL